LRSSNLIRIGLILALLQINAAGRTGNPAWADAPAPLISIHMVDAGTGWALTEKRLLRTTDGGTRWVDVTPQRSSLTRESAGDFLDGFTAWLSIPRHETGTIEIIRTADGGRTWRPMILSTPRVEQITFVNHRDGWILASRGAGAGSEAVDIFHTADGGTTWARIARAAPGNAGSGGIPLSGIKSGLSFLTSSVGWITGSWPVDDVAWFYMTQDGGRTWRRKPLPPPFSSARGQLNTMPPLLFPPSSGVLPVSFTSAVRSGTDFYTTRDAGKTWVSTALLPNYAAVWSFPDVRHGWAGAGSVLRATTDGARHWTALPDVRDLMGLDFVSPQQGWAVSSSPPFLRKTSDGGRTWLPVRYSICSRCPP
jgi:photosystem II stability/assembly factor-like uncharacterized protein